ncbi:hypothetical protein G6F56_012016 [Rhizopus delemar]|nr:hypothetical protein G6F56_012016 [Rhizopus delemar]
MNDLPTLEDVLSRKSQPPVCLYNYYIILRDRLNMDPWLDFWLDVAQATAMHKRYIKHKPTPTVERASPELLTRILLDNKKRVPTESEMAETVERIYLRYIVPNAEKEISQLPDSVRQTIATHFNPLQKTAFLTNDPVIYEEAKGYVLEMLRTSFPLFIKYKAFMNLTLVQQIIRLALGFFFLLIGFSVELSLIFLNLHPWQKRLWGILPIGLGVFFIVTSIVGIDPIWVLCFNTR